MVIKRCTHWTAKRFWDSQTSSPQTVLLTGLLGKTGVVVVVVVVCMCVCVGGGGGGEAISKLKGAGERMPSHAHTCMCPAYRGLFTRLSH